MRRIKTIAILAVTVCVLLVAGCTTPSSTAPLSSTTPSGTSSPIPTFPGKTAPDQVLPMNGTVTLGTGNNTIEVSLDSIEVDASTEPGTRTITIYVLARNTGTTPRKFVWFSKLTNVYGNSFGGIGISHNGNGARSGNISPGHGDAARDYIVIRSDDSFASLVKGAVLDVYFMDRTSGKDTMVPDYHVTWTVNPGVIR